MPGQALYESYERVQVNYSLGLPGSKRAVGRGASRGVGTPKRKAAFGRRDSRWVDWRTPVWTAIRYRPPPSRKTLRSTKRRIPQQARQVSMRRARMPTESAQRGESARAGTAARTPMPKKTARMSAPRSTPRSRQARNAGASRSNDAVVAASIAAKAASGFGFSMSKSVMRTSPPFQGPFLCATTLPDRCRERLPFQTGKSDSRLPDGLASSAPCRICPETPKNTPSPAHNFALHFYCSYTSIVLCIPL